MKIELEHKQIGKTNPLKVMLTIRADGHDVKLDNLDLSKEAKRKEFVASCVESYPGIDADDLNEKLMALASDLAGDKKPDDEEFETPLMLSAKVLDETDAEQVEAAKTFLKQPNLVDFVLRHIEDLGVVGEKSLVLGCYLISTSRLLSRPLAGIVVGASSSGKSYAVTTVAKLFPSEVLFQAHRITPAALQYLPSGSLVHRAVIAGERSKKTKEDEQAEATRALREMISDGVLRIAVAGKDAKGNLTTHHVEQLGPIAYIESTTLGSGEVFDEDKTRFVFLCADESEEQSKAVCHRLAEDAKSPAQNEYTETIITLHHTMQRLLSAGDVVIPYSTELVEAIPCRRPESRRAYGHLLNLIKSCALLHQYQRDRDGVGRVIADVADYDIIRSFLSDAIGRGLGVILSAGAEHLLDVIEDVYDYEDKFTVNDLKEKTGLGNILYDRVRELRSHLYIRIVADHSGQKSAQYERHPLPASAEGLVLPEIKKSSLSVPVGNE